MKGSTFISPNWGFDRPTRAPAYATKTPVPRACFVRASTAAVPWRNCRTGGSEERAPASQYEVCELGPTSLRRGRYGRARRQAVYEPVGATQPARWRDGIRDCSPQKEERG